MVVWLVAFATVCVVSCSDEAAPDPGGTKIADVFPDRAGLIRRYAVRDCTFSAGVGTLRLSQRRETLGTTMPDLLGRPLRQIQVDTADEAGTNFNNQAIWRQFRDESSAELYEGNERIVLLVNPLRNNTNWNGNRYNNRNTSAPQTTDTTFRILAADTSITVRGVRYERCVLVQHRRSRRGTQLDDVWTYVFYAPGIGKVLLFDRDYSYETIVPPRTPTPGSFLHVEELISTN